MINLFRLYNQNRKQFFIIILIIIAVIILLQLLNYLTKKNSGSEIAKNTITRNEYGKDHEAITGEQKDTETYDYETNIIKTFLDNCVNGDIEVAYDMISNDCKNALYPSINDFIDGYYNINFKNKKISYNYQAWSNKTYKIEIRENILATGMYSDSAYKEDYYTINGSKLNISGYVKKEQIDKEQTEENITVRVSSLEYYRDYLICNLSVFNRTDNDILLDSLESPKSIVLTDDNKVDFTFYNNELDISEVKLYKGEQKNIYLKFNIAYRENLEFERIDLKNIILSYEKYQNNELEQNDITDIEIDI